MMCQQDIQKKSPESTCKNTELYLKRCKAKDGDLWTICVETMHKENIESRTEMSRLFKAWGEENNSKKSEKRDWIVGRTEEN